MFVQDEIRQLAKQVMEGKNRYEAVQSLRFRVSVGEWGGRDQCVHEVKESKGFEEEIETNRRKGNVFE